jgi:hypothetical protein
MQMVLGKLVYTRVVSICITRDGKQRLVDFHISIFGQIQTQTHVNLCVCVCVCVWTFRIAFHRSLTASVACTAYNHYRHIGCSVYRKIQL